MHAAKLGIGLSGAYASSQMSIRGRLKQLRKFVLTSDWKAKLLKQGWREIQSGEMSHR